MKVGKVLFLVATFFLLFSPAVFAADPASETNSPAATGQAILPPATKEPPDVPAVKLDKLGQPSATWLVAHESILKRGKAGPKGCFLSATRSLRVGPA